MKGSKKHTVLLVDDSATNNLLLQVVFDQNGFNVETASSGKDAIKILAKKHIDVVLLDLMMPQMSGFEVLTAIKGNPETAKIPVLIVSADSERDDAEKALAMGAEYFFEKPLQLNEIVEKVKSILA
ncbi:MAG: response regulator [Salinivirgaceae bacterium]|nr:response regulator [Salinivirgaceae bacterium]